MPQNRKFPEKKLKQEVLTLNKKPHNRKFWLRKATIQDVSRRQAINQEFMTLKNSCLNKNVVVPLWKRKERPNEKNIEHKIITGKKEIKIILQSWSVNSTWELTGGRICDWDTMLFGRLFSRFATVTSAHVTWKPVIGWGGWGREMCQRKCPVTFSPLAVKYAVRFSGLANTFTATEIIQRKKRGMFLIGSCWSTRFRSSTRVLTFFSWTNHRFVTFTPYGRTRRRGEGNRAQFRVLLGFEGVNGHSVLAGEKQAGEVDEILLINQSINQKRGGVFYISTR